MHIQAVLFDVIGTTVIESDPSIVNNCFQQAFQYYNIFVTDNEVQNLRGRDKEEAITQLLAVKNNLTVKANDVLTTFKTNFRNNLFQFYEAEGLQEIVDYLRVKKIKIGVGTGLPADLFGILFDHLDWSKYHFDYIGISENLLRGRPHPDMIDDMIQKLNLNKSVFLKVGDTVADIEEGKNAKVLTAAILSRTVPDTVLFDCKPDFVIRSLSELKDFV